MKFLGKIENRILTIYDQEGYNHFLSSLEGRIVIDIRSADERSRQQNAYLWLYYRVISDETGHSPEELHEYCKQKFLTPTSKIVMGEEIIIPPSTTKLTKKEFNQYIEQISAHTQIAPPDLNLYLYE